MARKPPPPPDDSRGEHASNGDEHASRPGRNGNRLPPSSLWKPGESGNPSGRPKLGQSITGLLREAMHNRTLNGKPIDDGKRIIDLIVETACQKAIDGEFNYFREIMCRLDGKVPDRLTVEDVRKAYDIESSPETL